MGFCCDTMQLHVEETCDMHPNRWDCPKLLITLADDGDYGLTIFGSSAIQVIDYCPWCGARLKDLRPDDQPPKKIAPRSSGRPGLRLTD